MISLQVLSRTNERKTEKEPANRSLLDKEDHETGVDDGFVLMEYSLSVILHILHVTYVEGTSNAEHSAKSFGSGERVSTKFHLCCSSAFTRQVCFSLL